MSKLDLKKPGKLNATAENAKDFSFYLAKSPYEASDLEGGTKVKPDDLIFSKEGIAATKTGPTTRAGLVDLAPEQKKLVSRLDELEKKLQVPISRVYAYCIATSEEGARKLAAADELKIARPELELKVDEPKAFDFNYKDASKNVVEVRYEALNEVKDVQQAAPSDGNFKFQKANPGAKTPDRVAGSFVFKAEKPGLFDVPVTASSTRESIRPITKWVTLEAIAVAPDVQLSAGKTKCRTQEAIDLKVDAKGCTKVDLKCEPAGVFDLQPASLAGSGTVKATAKKEGSAQVKALGFVADAQACDASLDIEAGAPKLELSGDGKVAPGLDKPVMVEFSNLDVVELSLTPAGFVTIDKTALGKQDVVKLVGRSDGKAKLKAVGKIGGAVKLEKTLDVECIGPSLKLTKMGYRAVGE